MREAQVRMQKAVLWEEAKGKLRAMAMAGAYLGHCEPMTAEMQEAHDKRWMDVHDRIEGMINDIENEGLHE